MDQEVLRRIRASAIEIASVFTDVNQDPREDPDIELANKFADTLSTPCFNEVVFLANGEPAIQCDPPFYRSGEPWSIALELIQAALIRRFPIEGLEFCLAQLHHEGCRYFALNGLWEYAKVFDLPSEQRLSASTLAVQHHDELRLSGMNILGGLLGPCEDSPQKAELAETIEQLRQDYLIEGL